MKYKEITQELIPNLQSLLDTNNKKHMAAIQAVIGNIQGKVKGSQIESINKQLNDKKERIEELRLLREMRQLEGQRDNIDIETNQLEVDFEVPDELKVVLKQKKKTKKAKK